MQQRTPHPAAAAYRLHGLTCCSPRGQVVIAALKTLCLCSFALQNLQSVSGDITLRNSDSLASLDGLNSIQVVEGELGMNGLPIRTLRQLGNLTTVGELATGGLQERLAIIKYQPVQAAEWSLVS